MSEDRAETSRAGARVVPSRAWARVVFAAATLAIALRAAAQSPEGSFPLGPVYLFPKIELAVQRDSNIALQPEATRVADTISYVRPALLFEARDGVQRYDAGYRGEYASYRQVTSDNHNNHEVFATGDWTVSARDRVRLNAQYLDKFDPRGTLQIVTPVPNEYRQGSLSGLYAYGARDAAGRIEFYGSAYSKSYQNNRDQTAALDHSRSEIGSTFLVRVQPKTYGTLTARRYRYDYSEPGSLLDSEEVLLFAGARWDISAATFGRIEVGRLRKTFDTTSPGASSEFSGVAWEGALSWRPVHYSTIELVTQRRPTEATGAGDFVLNQSYQAGWTHVWGSRVTTVLTAVYSKDTYYGAYAPSPPAAAGEYRKDNTWLASVRVLYAVKRWFQLGADYAGSARSSNDDRFDYQRNQFTVLASFTI